MDPTAQKAPEKNIEEEKEKRNWLIHLLYVRKDFAECLKIIEEQLKLCKGLCEYAIYVKALIKRQKGQIDESLQLFQAATMLNPTNPSNLKQVGRSLYLLGKQKEAIHFYNEAQKYSMDDWEIWHNKGLCMLHVKQFENAEECFMRANAIQHHDITYMQLGRTFTMQERFQEAIDIYVEALDKSPENPELLTTIGLLYLRVGENFKAFDFLSMALIHDPSNPKTILATGSIIQDHAEMDVALSKYRIAAVKTPNSAQLWNNIGMCFFGQKNYIAAIACLKRATYLAPFEWIIAYNLGIVHLYTKQYASAFHYISASINLKADFAASYMYLAVTLARLDDFPNACSAYEKAIDMETDHVFELNYAITLFNHNHIEAAKMHFAEFEHLYMELDEETKNAEDHVMKKRMQLQQALANY